MKKSRSTKKIYTKNKICKRSQITFNNYSLFRIIVISDLAKKTEVKIKLYFLSKNTALMFSIFGKA